MTVDTYDDLHEQVTLVTGATRGIGRRVAADLADLGATVYAGARDPADVDIADADGAADPDAPADPDDRGTIRPVELDVTDDDQIAAALDRIDQEVGRLDALVNNAGVMDTRDPLDRTPTEAIDRVLATNLRGPMVLTRAALRRDLLGSGARVVNVSSGMGRLSRMGGESPAYRVSKTGLNGFTAYLDAEYPDLVASAVVPGWVRTDMGGDAAPRTVAEGADTVVWAARFRPSAPGGALWKDRERIEW